MERGAYAAQYGPTAGDRVRLADTDLFIQVERDLTMPGEEAVFGVGRVVRDGMGQGQAWRSQGAVDTVITNVLVLDAAGIVKADVGILDGRIEAIGKAGNPDIQPGVDITIGPATDIIPGEGRILTAGAVDAQVHWTSPRQVEMALAAGVTTMLGGGTGAGSGATAAATSPGPWHLWRMLQAADGLPVNTGFFGKGNASRPGALEEQVSAGAVGLTLHEAWGATPAALDCCLSVAERLNVQVTLQSDSLNESGGIEDAMAVFQGRTLHALRAGGGHLPDAIRLCGEPAVLPSSTVSTLPFAADTAREQRDILRAARRLDPDSPDDRALADTLASPATLSAEALLHDMGALSMVVSGAGAGGRAGEIVTRTWQTAHAMKTLRGRLPEDTGDADNGRVRRYIAKYTVNPARAHGIADHVGSVAVGRLADLVLWTPAFFGVKPDLVLKSGTIAMAAAGDPNATVPAAEPIQSTAMFAAFGRALTASSVTFVSAEAVATVLGGTLGLKKTLVPVFGCRSVTKADMVHNSATPRIEVDPETCAVRADGTVLSCDPVTALPMSQRYFMF
jgi:urease subunit alpha